MTSLRLKLIIVNSYVNILIICEAYNVRID